MIRHIVMWKFREGTEREQEQFLTGLQELFGVIPQLKRCEVKRCVGKDNYDAVLVSEFASMEDLQTYKDDPRHKAVSALCKSIRIDRVDPDAKNGRNLLITVTDEALLAKTGGIVQGMSGSPILQNGKLVGAVTHVLVNDPTMGYGVLIENMLDAGK